MLRARLSSFVLIALAACLPALVGCGSKGSPLSGKVVVPMKLEEGDSAQLLFVPESPKSPAASGTIKVSDLTFTANTADTTGVVPGKYKIAVILTSGKPGDSKRQAAFDDLNKTFSRDASKLSYEVTSGEQVITVDLVKATVTKN